MKTKAEQADIDKDDLEMLNQLLDKDNQANTTANREISMKVESFSDRLKRAKAEGKRLAEAEHQAKEERAAELSNEAKSKSTEALDYEEGMDNVTNPKDNDPHVKNNTSSKEMTFADKIKKARWEGRKVAEAEFQARQDHMAKLEKGKVSVKKK